MRSFLLSAAVAAGCALSAAPAGAALTATGPTAGNGYPSFYQDATGQQLALCGGGAPCPAVGAPFEDFYWDAEPVFSAPTVTSMRFAIEASDVGFNSTFGRIRYRLTNLEPGAEYKITQPFGVDTLIADSGGNINETTDIGCAAGPCNFAAAQPTVIGPFLRWDPSVAPQAPAGFIGDLTVGHKVVGSPTGNNFVQVDGPNAGGAGINTVRTDMFDLAGKVNGAVTPMGSVERAKNLGAPTVGQSSTAPVIVKNDSTVAMPLTASSISGPNAADFSIASTTCGGSVPAAGSCTITVGFAPSASGNRSATLTVGLPAGSAANTTALTGAGTNAVAAPAPVVVPAPAPVIVAPSLNVALLRVSGLKFRSRLSAKTARRSGIRVSYKLPASLKYVQVELYRLRGTKATLVTRKRGNASALTLRSSLLKRGAYRLQVTPGLSATQLGRTSKRRITLV